MGADVVLEVARVPHLADHGTWRVRCGSAERCRNEQSEVG